MKTQTRYLEVIDIKKSGESEQEKKNITADVSFSKDPYNETICSALYVKCSNSFYDNKNVQRIHNKHEMGENTPRDVILSPWNAEIYTDGIYRCSGILISLDWIVSATKCVGNIQ